jgi:transaldolase/glucose-6-phosphate isomerase
VEDGLRGVTSNPAIFEKAIVGSTDYESVIESKESAGLDAKGLYEKIAVKDVQDAADILRPVYDESKRHDGYVSLEVSPLLANDTAGTLQEARRLWKTVGRENLMVKVPATPEGIQAVRQLISEGINVNVTLLFSRDVYEQVANAYIEGLTARAASGADVSRIASVASFFVSRIDSKLDAQITNQLKTATDPIQRARLSGLLGKVAIANAKLAYHRFTELYSGEAWAALAKKGAQPQRLLWASTSTKNPGYRDVIYVEELIGPSTVNTIPPASDRRPGERRGHHGIGGACRHLDENRDKHAFRRGPASVRGRVRAAPESHGIAARPGIRSEDQFGFLHPPDETVGRRRQRAHGLGEERQSAAFVASRRLAVVRIRRESLARLAWHHR